MSQLREIEETPETDAIVAAAEAIGVEPERMEEAITIYKHWISHPAKEQV